MIDNLLLFNNIRAILCKILYIQLYKFAKLNIKLYNKDMRLKLQLILAFADNLPYRDELSKGGINKINYLIILKIGAIQ